MLKNHLKIAIRNLTRHKGYTLISTRGLVAGLACWYPDKKTGIALSGFFIQDCQRIVF